VPVFVVESYVPNASTAVADSRARAQRAGTPDDDVRYVRTTFFPDDELVLHVFEAASDDALRRAAARVALTYERISPAVEDALPAGPTTKETT
jgi:hypothetical protein